ncbi:MAG: helix-turn-helix transcriptional regulator [Nitrospirae bacterium]|nr:helix-turn-helix transcriptional regulator [Nitrospirota bacterium]
MSARRVRQIRKRLGLTQAELAERLGTTRTTISRWEAGIRQPSRMVLNALGWLVEISGKSLKGGKRA